MRKKVPFIGITIFIILLAVAAVIGWRLFRSDLHADTSVGQVECPNRVDLGECVYGSEIRKVFSVRNVGRGPVSIHSFGVSCTCSSIKRCTEDGDVPIEDFTLGAGEEVNIAVTIQIRSRFNDSAKTRITFQTTDPLKPEAIVDLSASRVIGGLTPLPSICNFGTVLQGQECSKIIHLVDEAVKPRVVTAIVAGGSESIRVVFRPSLDHIMPADVVNPGHYLGSIAIAIDTSSTDSIDGHIDIHYDDGTSKIESIPVFGTIASKITAMPTTVALRPDGKDGKFLSGSVWLRTQGRVDFSTIRFAEPNGFRAELAASESNFAPVRIVVEAAKFPRDGAKQSAVLTAKVDGVIVRVTISLFAETR